MRAIERRLQQLAERPFVLAAGVVVLLAIGAAGLGLRDEVELGRQGPNIDFTPTLLVLLGACAIAFVVVLAVMPKNRPGGTAPSRRRNPLMQALGLGVAGLLFFLAVKCAPKSGNAMGPAIQPPTAVDGMPGDGGGSAAGAQGAGLTLALLVAIAIAAAVGLFLWRNRAAEPVADEQSDAEDLRQVIAAGQAALSSETDARGAVIAAYAAMESALARAGVHRRIADTPTEVLARAGQAGLFGPSAAAAAAELTELFERARFSDRPMPLGAREYAERALAGMDADLEAAIARAAAAREAREAKAAAEASAR